MSKKIQLAIYCLGILLISFSANGKNYYFSSSTGNDSNTNSASTPWKTITKLNSVFSTLLPGDSVLFKRGDTFYGSVTVAASGSASSPIVLGAYGSGAKPVITGFVSLTSWTSIGNGIYESHNASFTEVVNSLTFDGQAREMGRWPKRNAPNSGYRTISSAVSNTSITDNSLGSSPSWTGGEVVIRKSRWTLDRNKITSHSGSTIYYTTGNGASANAGFGYFIQNHIKTLTELGDWYYNPATQKMNVFFGSNAPAAHSVKAATSKYLITIVNRSYITLTDLDLEGGNIGNIRIKDGGTGVVIKRCDVNFAGEIGIEVDNHERLVIENCVISNSNDSGINISSDSQYATVRNNTVENSGVLAGMGNKVGSGYVGIHNHSNYGITEYNRVIKSGYHGIVHKFVANKIRYNYVDTFCFIKDDGGGIYGHNGGNYNHTGTQIIGNIVLNGIGATHGTNKTIPNAFGIYLDDNANGVEVKDNTAANCSRGLYLHNARNIIVTKNTFYNNELAQMYCQNDGIGDEIVKLNINDNIFFAKEQLQLAVSYFSTQNKIEEWGYFDNNFYCRPIKDDNTIKYRHSVYGPNETMALDKWKTSFKPYDSASKKSPLTVTDANKEIRFEYNATSNPKTIALDAVYTDVKGVQYTKLTLAAFSSAVLIKSGTITNTTPNAPTVSVVNNCNGTSTLTAKNYTGSLLWSTGETASVITVKQAGTYTVTQTVNGTKSAPGEGTANPKPTPNAPTASGATYCTGDQIANLTASGATGATFKWYKNSDLASGSLVYTGASFATGISTTAASVTTYWVTQSVSSCESSATSVTVTLKECNTTTPSDPTPPDASVNGLNYSYYTTNSSNPWKVLPDFSKLTPVKTGIINNFNLSPRTQSDYFGFAIEGLIEIDVAGTYTFYTYSDDGSQLFINDKLIVNNDGVHGKKEISGTVYLAAGKHPIKVNYFDYINGETLSVRYAGPGISKRLIPDNKLFLGNSSSGSTTSKDSDNSSDSTAPSDLTAIANAYYSIASLGWKDNSSNEKGFEIHMSVGNNTSYKQVGSTGADKIRYSVSITKGQVYYFKVRAKIGTTYSDFSNEVLLSTDVASTSQFIPADSLGGAGSSQSFGLLQTTVYPNPASEYVNIAFGNEFNGPVRIQLIDLTGQQLHTQITQAEAGSTCWLNIERNHLLPGLYMINISNGIHTKSIKLYIE